jgi:S1-C subfamily serine protease
MSNWLPAGQTARTEWSAVVSETKAAVVVLETDRGLGSGFVVRPNGTLVTNQHVIAGASQISVTFSSGEKYHKAFVLAEDEDRDLAILRIEGSGLPALSVGSTADVNIGDEVLLIGAPEGLSHTVSTGVVSAFRLLKNGMKVIQTTASASPGSSGGPLLTREGRVIGVLTFQFMEGQNLNFAVPSNYVQGMLETLEKFSAGTPVRTLTKLATRSAPGSTSGPTDSAKPKISGVLFVACRTEKHRAYSSTEVFQGIVDDVLLFLKQRRLHLANDDLGRTLQFENTVSTYEVTAAAKKAGASHVMVLTVDRPVSAWVKLRLQCLTADGRLLWEEQAQNGSWTKRGAAGVKAAMEEFKAQMTKRMAEAPLPTDDAPPKDK